MNIVMITELFTGMEDGVEQRLGQSTVAIYDLIKHWSKKHNLLCIREVPLGWKRWLKYKIGKLFGKTSVYDEIPEFYEVSGITVYTVKYLSYPHNRILGKPFYKRIAEKIKRILKNAEYKPDIIIAHMPTFNIMYYIERLRKGIPTVAVLHRSDLDKLYRKGAAVKYKIDLLNTNFNKICSRSKAICMQAKRLGLSNLTDDIILSSVPMNVKHDRNWSYMSKREINILYVGALIEQKGVQLILKSVSELIDKYMLKVIIVGSGSYETKLRILARDLQIENYIEFVGQKSREEVYGYMRNADIFIMPSYHETLGLVYLEAMSSGCITIGTRGEGIDGIIVNEENGYLVGKNDVTEIIKCLDTIMCMSEKELEQISNAAVETMRYYNEENVSERYLEIIEKTVIESGSL